MQEKYTLNTALAAVVGLGCLAAVLYRVFLPAAVLPAVGLPAAQLVYGVGCGALTVLFRYFGLYPEGVTYAILLMNACAWALDKALPPVRFGAVRGGKAG